MNHHRSEQGRSTGRPHVVIVGGGFAGLNAAKGLASSDLSVTVVDRRNHHVFQPLLYEVATAGLTPSDVAFPIRAALRGSRNTKVLLGTVTGVDRTQRTVELEDGSTLPFDYLVVATGARHAYFGHPEWEADAPGLKTLEDAIEIRRRILLCFEGAERTSDPVERTRLLTFVIVGGGPTGVELAGAIADIATRTMTRDFRSIVPSTARVVLVEGSDRLLGTYPPSLSERAAEQLRHLGVEVRTSTMVTAVDERGVDTADGRLDAGCVLWAAGVAASPLGAHLGVVVDRAGRVAVEPDLSLPGDDRIFVVGDLALVMDRGRQVPGVAPAAMQEGRHVAAMIRADLAGEQRTAFRYSDKGSLAQVGRTAAVADFGRFRFSGLPAWTLWWSIHIVYLIGFRNRILVLLSWGWSWFTTQRGARLITSRWTPGPPD